MHLRSFLTAAFVLLSASFTAQATTFTYTASPNTGGTLMSSPYAASPGFQTATFDAANPASFSVTGGFVTNGSTSGQTGAPLGETTTSKYFAVGAPTTYTGTALFTLTGGYNYFGLYWGSIDAYNTISFYSGGTYDAQGHYVSGGTLIGSVTGSQIPPANGSQTAADTNEYVNFYFTGGTYDHVVLSTTSANFELDNVTYGNVTPEPSSLALLGTGLLGIAGAVRKRIRA